MYIFEDFIHLCSIVRILWFMTAVRLSMEKQQIYSKSPNTKKQ